MIKTYEAQVVPGLLQIPEYARALFAADCVPDVERAVEGRMSRQAILTTEPPPQLWVLLSENALDWPIGGAEVMRKQLGRLLEASEQPAIGIRVLPRSAGAHVGLNGSFKIMSTEAGDIAYTDSPGGGRLVPAAEEVRDYGGKVRPDRAARAARRTVEGQDQASHGGPEMNTPVWRKSSHSGTIEGSDCVEVADLSGVIADRDSKNPDGPQLALSGRSFAKLLSRVKSNKLT